MCVCVCENSYDQLNYKSILSPLGLIDKSHLNHRLPSDH